MIAIGSKVDSVRYGPGVVCGGHGELVTVDLDNGAGKVTKPEREWSVLEGPFKVGDIVAHNRDVVAWGPVIRVTGNMITVDGLHTKRSHTSDVSAWKAVDPCGPCSGTGKVRFRTLGYECPVCKGRGWVTLGTSVKVGDRVGCKGNKKLGAGTVKRFTIVKVGPDGHRKTTEVMTEVSMDNGQMMLLPVDDWERVIEVTAEVGKPEPEPRPSSCTHVAWKPCADVWGAIIDLDATDDTVHQVKIDTPQGKVWLLNSEVVPVEPCSVCIGSGEIVSNTTGPKDDTCDHCSGRGWDLFDDDKRRYRAINVRDVSAEPRPPRVNDRVIRAKQLREQLCDGEPVPSAEWNVGRVVRWVSQVRIKGMAQVQWPQHEHGSPTLEAMADLVVVDECPTCSGGGWVTNGRCMTCEGCGAVPTEPEPAKPATRVQWETATGPVTLTTPTGETRQVRDGDTLLVDTSTWSIVPRFKVGDRVVHKMSRAQGVAEQVREGSKGMHQEVRIRWVMTGAVAWHAADEIEAAQETIRFKTEETIRFKTVDQLNGQDPLAIGTRVEHSTNGRVGAVVEWSATHPDESEPDAVKVETEPGEYEWWSTDEIGTRTKSDQTPLYPDDRVIHKTRGLTGEVMEVTTRWARVRVDNPPTGNGMQWWDRERCGRQYPRSGAAHEVTQEAVGRRHGEWGRPTGRVQQQWERDRLTRGSWVIVDVGEGGPDAAASPDARIPSPTREPEVRYAEDDRSFAQRRKARRLRDRAAAEAPQVANALRAQAEAAERTGRRVCTECGGEGGWDSDLCPRQGCGGMVRTALAPEPMTGPPPGGEPGALTYGWKGRRRR